MFSNVFNRREYQYRYMATTGICNHIYYNNKLIAIKFHHKSNKKKLDLLYSLGPEILYPSSERIYLIGKLHHEIKQTPRGKNFPSSEKYQEFELIHWYILCPFKESVGLPSDLKFIERKKLLPDDIGIGDLGALFIDIKDFYRIESNHR